MTKYQVETVMNLIKNKKNYFLCALAIFLVLFITITITCSRVFSNNVYYLDAEGRIELNIKGNYDNIDAYMTFEIASEANNGKIRLSGRNILADIDSHIIYNIEKQQIEKWIDTDNDGVSELTILPNDTSQSIYIDSKGLVINLPNQYRFSINSSKDFSIVVENISNTSVSFSKNVKYN
ncbi:hypothetical protein [Streptococcus suis]|uniref:hypothetical protein n=1 Tax=Streptococcus suis TaxID=1307 RepID=UPI001617D86C|nr:hypothetical protein [Streptococcus suis]